ncbi:MAG: sigma factor, partial [Candidatus Hinthialibacter sp.]
MLVFRQLRNFVIYLFMLRIGYQDDSMTKNAEATLVSQVLNGRRECYRPLVEKYQMKVYLLACSMLGNPSEAQDIAQETFL